ncbi:DUF1924 domain-containing protein [Nitrogeniibacter aestuarii]|uniref:DUF1924 domain-containing protein n=1 Tax=Nitrogeniibacter aestuarii TaxID=2815343 RepID=UPI001E3B0A90|nr:DUF1924 domain-containing protein [Nitrogeniibacter aestuarii]
MAKQWSAPVLLTLSMLGAPAVLAATPESLVAAYAAQAGVPVESIDVAVGEALFRQGGGSEKQCSSCHTQDPRAAGRTKVGKRIEPMAPAANPQRFTDEKKVEKWFGRNCKDVLARECTPLEKASLIAWLAGLDREGK